MGSDTFQNSTESRHPFGMARQLPFFSKRKIVIRERRFLIFMVGSSLVDTRSVFSETAKKENFNFSFLLFSSLRDEVPNKSLYIEKPKVLYIQVGYLIHKQEKALIGLNGKVRPYGKTSIGIFVIFWCIDVFAVFGFELECHS